MKKDLVRLTDLSRADIEALIDSAARLKDDKAKGIPHTHLSGKTLGMVFNKSSTRTRISFEVGMVQLGGYPLFLSGAQLQMTRGETVSDTARIFSRYVGELVIRTYEQSEVDELAEKADIPVINALTDMYHPCQILADMLTIVERHGSLDGVKVAYVGDGNNIAHSWLLGASIMGVDLSIATPEGYRPDAGVVSEAKKIAAGTGANIELISDPAAAAKDAHVLYTDTWVSMGQEEEAKQRLADFNGYQVNAALVTQARPDVMVMHCLPAHRGEEISAEVMDGPNSVVWDEAENRLHIQKAVLLALMG